MAVEISIGARDIEGLMEDLDHVYRVIDQVEDIDELRHLAATLRQVAANARTFAGSLTEDIRLAEEAEEDTCPECSTPLCAGCGECPVCGDCCVFQGVDDVDDDFPMYLEYDDWKDDLVTPDYPE